MYYILEKEEHLNKIEREKERNTFFLSFLKSNELEKVFKENDGKTYNKRFTDKLQKVMSDFISANGLSEKMNCYSVSLNTDYKQMYNGVFSNPLVFHFKTLKVYFPFSSDFYLSLKLTDNNRLKVDYELFKESVTTAIKRYETENESITLTQANYSEYAEKIKQLEELCEECNKLPHHFRQNLSKTYISV